MSTHNNTYVLLRDYPITILDKILLVKKGTEITLGMKILNKYLSSYDSVFDKQIVENNPEWFKRKEPLFTTEDGVDLYDMLTPYYVVSKKSIKYCNMGYPIAGSGFICRPNEYVLFSNKEAADKWIEDNKLKEGKILEFNSEQFLNNFASGFTVVGVDEYYANRNNPNPTKAPQKDYEILSYSNLNKNPMLGGIRVKGEDGKYRFDLGLDDEPCNKEELQDWDIHSIKRLSDGQVFTVGEKFGQYEVTKFVEHEKGLTITLDKLFRFMI